MDKEYDVVFVGAGHNGLTCAAYLSKAGLKTINFERREVIGGACTTEEITLPGFKHNTHSTMHTWIFMGPVYNDLELEKYGAKYIFPEAGYAVLFSDENSLIAYNRDLDIRLLQKLSHGSLSHATHMSVPQ